MEFLRKKEAISYFSKRSDNKDVVLLAKDINENGSKKFIVTHKKKLYKTIKDNYKWLVHILDILVDY